jgi:hypothetical protein
MLYIGERDQDCVQSATLHLFDAPIGRLVHGDLPARRFPVLGGAHALPKAGMAS